MGMNARRRVLVFAVALGLAVRSRHQRQADRRGPRVLGGGDLGGGVL
jgi:hypothetical protein